MKFGVVKRESHACRLFQLDRFLTLIGKHKLFDIKTALKGISTVFQR